MTPFDLNPPSPSPHVEGNQAQDPLLFTQTSSYSCPIYFKATQEQENYEDHQQHNHKADIGFSTGGSGEQNLVQTLDDHHYYDSCIKPTTTICEGEDGYSDPCENAPVKWMSSKMRLMRKMMNSDRTVNNKLISDAPPCPNDLQLGPSDYDKINNSINNMIRVCADCNTTKTPLWRSGPRGPKSLCNACGIRQRKARRALAAAAMAANGRLVPTDPSMAKEKCKVQKEKQTKSVCTIQYKKRCKMAGPRTKKKLRFDEFTVSLSKNSAIHRVFPQDEMDAAILLMALSCGLVQG